MNNRIIYIEEKLAKLRIEYKTASPAMKKFLEVGAKLLKEEKASLEKRAENEQEEKDSLILPLDKCQIV